MSVKLSLTLRQEHWQRIRFQGLKAASMNMAIFWEVAPCILVETDRHFRGAYCLHHQDYEYLTTQRNTPEDGNFHWQRKFKIKVLRKILEPKTQEDG
jgi:hypothetical protein